MHVPGWYEATRALREQGKFQTLGIVQEQHPDRARLFMQYKQMDFPVLADPLSLLGVSVVPITLAIDEHGIVRLMNPRPEDIGREFLNREFTAPHGDQTQPDGASDSKNVWQRPADKLFMSGDPESCDTAIKSYRELLQAHPDSGVLHFRLGVAYRTRYDSEFRQADDFLNAVRAWTRALELNPNNYIWRRRIQQYGPRLIKPYPFYDWVPTARKEIAARGESPVTLRAEPGAGEYAKPARDFETASGGLTEPDPDGKITRDEDRFIATEITVVPSTIGPGQAARVYVTLRPDPLTDGHWNNEAGPLALWIEPSTGWQVDRRRHEAAVPRAEVSNEARTIEFEIRSPADAGKGPVELPAYALYYVCQGKTGACLYRRADLRIPIEVRRAAP